MLRGRWIQPKSKLTLPHYKDEVCKIYDSKIFFQAILFYIPRWLWKNWEAGKIGALKMDLDLGIITEAEKRQKKKLLLDYLYANLKNHNFWAYRYFFCEFLALLNVIGEYIFSLLSLILALKGPL